MGQPNAFEVGSEKSILRRILIESLSGRVLFDVHRWPSLGWLPPRRIPVFTPRGQKQGTEALCRGVLVFSCHGRGGSRRAHPLIPALMTPSMK
jgi:hypothetical protein